MSKLLCNTSSPESRLSWPHTQKAARYLGEAKLEVIRALRLFPEEVPLPNRPHPARYRLQQVAGTISLLIGIVEPLAEGETAPVQMQCVSAIMREKAKECGVDLDRLNAATNEQSGAVSQ
jgi:hypothetical protein